MQPKALFFFGILSVFAILSANAGGGGGKGKETVKIIIPVHEKTIKHTHTIYKTIHHGGGDKDPHGLELIAKTTGGGGGHGWW